MKIQRHVRKILTSRSGLSLVEILIAMTLMALVALGVARGLYYMSSHSNHLRDKTFATQKAIQMMEELRGLIADSSVGVLDNYDDGAAYKTILTTSAGVTNPEDPLSGNKGLKYVRQINVVRLPNEDQARQVYVRVFEAGSRAPLAETMSVLRTIKNQYVPTQVYDAYILALENVPGWWSALSTMKPTFDNIIQDLQTRNPGLEIRPHYITRLAYGRDPYYTPYINGTTYTNTTAPPWVYFYPGLMQKSSPVQDFLYFDPDAIGGRLNVDGTIQHAASYSIADQYNHAVRYPDELNLYSQAVANALASGNPSPEISLRMLLEQLNSSPSNMANLLLINLHGELLPLPPMRNYSDAAKDPAGLPNLRVVTHPGKLQYAAAAAVRLRVYPYAMTPDSYSDATFISSVTVRIGASINSSNISVRKVIGNSTSIDYSWQDAVSGSDYQVTAASTWTVVTLWNSPVRHAKYTGSNRGLASANRLYGLEYIPCEAGNPGTPEFPEGVRDLTMNNPNSSKNTARWVIQIATGTLANGQYTVETRIGTDMTTGFAGHVPENLSRTYVWVGQTPPVTEQYQFVGDPRHMPYTDVKANDGYNWFFAAIPSGDYQGYTKTSAGWNGNGGAVLYDVPRYFQMYRRGLLASGGIWTTMTGFSFYYTGMGGEMGADASNGFPNGLPIMERPWVPAGGSQAKVDEITNDTYGSGTQSSSRIIASTDNSWVSLPWIGELYPDSAAATWSANGNLATGSGQYYRANYTTFSSLGLGFGQNPVKRTSERACASLFNGNTTGAGSNYFNHEYADSYTGTLATAGSTISQVFNFPLLSSINAFRPFTLSYSGASRRPTEWNDVAYSGQRTTLTSLETYYTSAYSGSYNASSLVTVGLGSEMAFFVVNGLSTQSNFGTAETGKLCLIDMIRGFLRAGAPDVSTGRVVQVPLLTINTPLPTEDLLVNPSTVNITWSIAWSRWDGKSYTETYPANFAESSTVVYNVKYSADAGTTWAFVQDGASAQAGVLDVAHSATSPLNWSVGSLARGSYVLRVEAYRQNKPLHSSYHQHSLYIQR